VSQGESPLSRRIEALAAQVREDDGGRSDAPGLGAAVAALRSELGAVRADFATLRAEVGAVRSDLDSVGGRMTGGLASSRTETAAVTRRMDELGSRLEALGVRVDDVRTALPALTRELHEGLDTLPLRTGERLTDSVRDLGESLAGRVEQATADVRRALGSGLDQVSAQTQATESALAEARGVLEGHAAALEDALDGAADRLESVARDGHDSARETLRAFADRSDAATGRIEGALGALAGSLSERSDALRGDLLGAQEHTRSIVERVEGSTGSLHGELWRATDELGGRLERAVGESTTNLHAARDEARQSLSGELAEHGGFVRAALESLDSRLADARSTMSDAVASGREETAGELGRLGGRVDEVVGSARAAIEGEVSSLRIDLADALEEVRDRVAEQIETGSTSVRSALAETRTEVTARTTELRGVVLHRVETGAASTLARLSEVTASLASTAATIEVLAGRLAALEQAVGRSDATVAGMRTEWGQRATDLIADARAAAEASTEQVRTEVGRQLQAVSAEMANAVDAVSTAREGLDAETGRLTGAGEALLGYLERRDRELEQERDRVLREVLEEFAAGLSGRERRNVAAKVGEALDRRRDIRDAERWRSLQATGSRSKPDVALPATGSPSRSADGTTSAHDERADDRPAAVDPPADAPPEHKSSNGGSDGGPGDRAAAPAGPPRARRRSPRVEMPTVRSPDAALDAAAPPPAGPARPDARRRRGPAS